MNTVSEIFFSVTQPIMSIIGVLILSLIEIFYYLVDRLDDLCYEIDDWRRETPKESKWIVMAIIGFFLGLIFLSGCLTVNVPSASTTKATLDEWMCVPSSNGQVLHCGSYDAWKRWEEEQMKKNGF